MDRIAGLSAGLKSLLSIRKATKSENGDVESSPSGGYQHGSGSSSSALNENRGSPFAGATRVDDLVKEQLNALSDGLSIDEIDDLN